MRVKSWTKWSFDNNLDLDYYEAAEKAVINELKEKGYHFDGYYHQRSNKGCPVLDNGQLFAVSERRWGTIMAKAFPEEFVDPNDKYNYLKWSSNIHSEKCKYPNLEDYK